MPAERDQSVTVIDYANRGGIVIAVSMACIALGSQLLLIPVVAVDTNQLYLGAVAVSSIYGGSKAGLLTLLISSFGKVCFFMPSDILALDAGFVIRTVLFLAVAGVICWIGGRFHASEQRLVAVLTSIGDAVIATDQRGRIKFMNPAAEALSGWTRTQAVKRNLSDVIHLRDQAGVFRMTSDYCKNPDGQPLFTKIEDGTILDSRAGFAIPITGSISVISNQAGAKSGVVVVLRDFTDHRQAERERDRLLQDLKSALAKVKLLSEMRSGADFTHSLCPDCVKHYFAQIETDPNPEMIQQADRE
jgi:PAS domain S-box-containing protein